MIREFILILALVSLASSHSENILFTISTNESLISLGGTAAGFPIQEQSPGSLTTHFSGQIQAQISGTNILFPGGSAVDGITNGNWQPMAGGTSGSAPADYGGKANIFGATAYAAFRNLLLDLQSGSVPLKSDSSFDATGLIFLFPTNGTSTFDYDGGAIIGHGSQRLGGYSTNRTATTGSITQTNGATKLVIPINAQFTFKLLRDNDSTIQLTGQIVALSSSGSASGPSFVSISLKNQVLTLVVQGSPNQAYRLQSSTDLVTWTPRTATVTTTSSGQYTYTTTATGAREFFRIVL